ncbi:protein Dok-7 [Gracilinanus agilis]|uniref:protein Dok-7 n=1 Tax=Gracilinanus agilis TaxID=191870 RepID=UPI001CFC92FB|nr:protein Dok-7 [Gracilinanus agilis]
MTDSVVVEGQVKLRDGKKWKTRWLVLRKPSPVADCLLMLVYKDRSERAKGYKERSSLTLEDICGLDPGLPYEGLTHTLAIICLSQAVMLGFESKDTMYAWDIRIRYSLGEVHRFHVAVAPGTKLESGLATLHLCNDILVLAKDIPPAVMGQWKLSDLRRYGAVPNGFIFEGGTRCGYWAGVFFLSCTEGEQISFLFDCIVRGISPTKGPFGLRPVLPDPNPNPSSMEERVAHEALQLEKRLSLLSHSSRPGSGGDDRSLSSSSSDTSHSDASAGSRLTLWPEQSSASTSQESHGLAAAKSLHLGEDKAHAEAAHGATKPLPKPLRSRQLQEIGRQSSSDSGIATGSHSSYSGSFSSYAGSLDICHGDEFGSLLSLPLNFASEQSLCTCPPSEPPRGLEYQVPSSFRHLYDTPRSVLQAAAKDTQPSGGGADSTGPKDQAPGPQQASDPKAAPAPLSEAGAASEPDQDLGGPTASLAEGTKDLGDETYADFLSRWSGIRPPGQVLESQSSESVSPSGVSAEPCEMCSPRPGAPRAFFTSCPVCGGLKGAALFPLRLFPAPSGERSRSETPTYVNIPVSPTSKKQLHYMELELQEPSPGIRGAGATRYAQIDITATETAHKVGAQHAQTREERLQELEQKQKGTHR